MNAAIGELTRRRKLVILASCCLSLLIVTMDMTIVNVAIPSIRAEFGASGPQLQWVIDIYTLVLASLLFDYVRDQFGERVSNLFRAGFYLPQILPITTAGVLWGWILSPVGVANIVFKAVGLDGLAQNWIGDATYALPAVSLMIVWIQVGYCLVVFMAGLSRIDPSLYEAAQLDGAPEKNAFREV